MNNMQTIGIIGGGQLGRMLAMAAARLNYHTIILEPQKDCPASQVANRQIVAAYDDKKALAELAKAANIITYEFENVPVKAAKALEKDVPVYPPPRALEVSQDRLSEKEFLKGCGITTADFIAVDSQEELEAALSRFGRKGVLKTRRMGYDGKGQKLFKSGESSEGVFEELGGVPLILESLVPFIREVSIIAARGGDGSLAFFDTAENVHKNGILHTSTVPANIAKDTAAAAEAAAKAILDALHYVGVIGVELFVLEDGSIAANGIAPRVHNSGHWTEDACLTSQFEQHMRAVAGWRLGACARHSDVVMENLIGDECETWPEILADPNARLHLYGKREARPGRKMGHVNRISPLTAA